jgi:hypothetical protein
MCISMLRLTIPTFISIIDKVFIGQPDSVSTDTAGNCLTPEKNRSNTPEIARYEIIDTDSKLINWGTAFRLYNGNFITAEHMIPLGSNYLKRVSFNVPDSDSLDDRAVAQYPDVVHQYTVNTLIARGSNSQTPAAGDDWAVFTVFDNDSISVYTRGGFDIDLFDPGDVGATVTGYAKVEYGEPWPLLQSHTQQTSTGVLVYNNNPDIRFNTYTYHGHSGGPIINATNNHVLGVVSQSDCPHGGNLGASFLNPVFGNFAETLYVAVDQGEYFIHKTKPIHITMDMGHRHYGVIWRLTNQWDGPYTNLPHTFKLMTSESSENLVFLADKSVDDYQDKSYKFHHWSGNKYILASTFPLTTTLNSYFEETVMGVAMQAALDGAPSAAVGNIEFRDPWLVDAMDEYKGTKTVNRGMTGAEFKQRVCSISAPFTPNRTAHYDSGAAGFPNGVVYNGVFLNQGDVLDLQPPYYSVRAPLIQTINNTESFFDHWEIRKPNGTAYSADDPGAALVNVTTDNVSGYDTKAVIFYKDSVAIKAVYKPYSVVAAWNMLSVPRPQTNWSASAIYPGAASVQTFDGEGYQTVSALKNGKGYWVKYDSLPNPPLTYGSQDLTSVIDTVGENWNMIGTLPYMLDPSQVQASMTNVTSSYFGFSPTSGYYPTDYLKPGSGYWVKVSGLGTLTLNKDLPVTSGTTPGDNAGLGDPPSATTAPAAPQLSSPANAAANQSTNAMLTWQASSGATYYTVQWSTSSGFSGTVYEDQNVVAPYKQLSSLPNSITYYWRVNARNSHGVSAWSSTWSFTTIATPPPPAPAPPALVSPVNGSQNVPLTVTFYWTGAYGATSYTLQTSTDPYFSTYGYNTTTGTSYTKNYVVYNTLIYWRVSVTTAGGTSPWSAVWSFRTASEPPPPDPCGGYAMAATYPALDEIVVTNGNGLGQKFYVRNSGRGVKQGLIKDDEMPPEPKGNIFHARFASGKFIETIPSDHAQKRIPIHLKRASFPVTISWDIKPENQIEYILKTKKHRHGHENDDDDIKLVGKGHLPIDEDDNGNIVIIASTSDPCLPELEKNAATRPDLGTPDGQIAKPDRYLLSQNYPNPFNPVTTIRYQLPEEARVSLIIYNVLGQEVAKLVDEVQNAGYKQANFNVNNISSGVYFYRLRAGSFTDIKKMMVVK